MEFKSKMNAPLPIELGTGEAISVAAKGRFSCTAEEADSNDIRAAVLKGLLKEIKKDSPEVKPGDVVVETLDEVAPEVFEYVLEEVKEESPQEKVAGPDEGPLGLTMNEPDDVGYKPKKAKGDDKTSDDNGLKNDDFLTSPTEMMESEGEEPVDDGVDVGSEKPKKKKGKKKK